jgi:hypothetical protein
MRAVGQGGSVDQEHGVTARAVFGIGHAFRPLLRGDGYHNRGRPAAPFGVLRASVSLNQLEVGTVVGRRFEILSVLHGAGFWVVVASDRRDGNAPSAC